MKRRKIVILGIDSGTWDLFGPAIDRGFMSHLAELRDKGAYGVLYSTDPPVTPAAWTTMITGVYPGKHGVIGFERFDSTNNQLFLSKSSDVKTESMWTHLSRHGFTVASLNVPYTYPPYEVNGIMVSGYGSPGPDYDITYPKSFKKLLDERIENNMMLGAWINGDLSDRDVYAKNIALTNEILDQSVALAQLVDGHQSCDVLMVEVQQFDKMLHKNWGYIDPNCGANWEKYADISETFYRKFDDMVYQISQLASGEDDILMITSDHGHGPAVAKVKPNQLLREWGYLKQKSVISQQVDRFKKNLKRLGGLENKHKGAGNDIEKKYSLNLSKTKAFVSHTAHDAYLYINGSEYHVQGCVAPGYETLLNELKEKFLAVTDTKNGKPAFKAVKTTVEIFGVTRQDNPSLPDLVIEGADGYMPVRDVRGVTFIKYVDDAVGCHRSCGMYLIAGKGIHTEQDVDASIADIVPTVYALLGIPEPSHLEGAIMRSQCGDAIVGVKQRAVINDDNQQKTKVDADLTTQQEEDDIRQRLADLGYLE